VEESIDEEELRKLPDQLLLFFSSGVTNPIGRLGGSGGVMSSGHGRVFQYHIRHSSLTPFVI
jgi:hypothetical protein